MVVSGFLGLDSLKETVRGMNFGDAMQELIVKGVQTATDPFLVFLGEKFLNKRWRKFDR